MIEIRNLLPSDLSQVEVLDNICKKYYKNVLTGNVSSKVKEYGHKVGPIPYIYGAFENKKMVGYCTIEKFGEQNGSVLSNVLVVPSMQGKGVGSKMVSKALKGSCKPVYLDYMDGQGPFYERFGFVEITTPSNGIMVLE